MARATRPNEAEREPVDDYQVDRDWDRAERPAAQRILTVIKGLLLLILAAVSLALFWVVATLLGIF